MPIGPHRSQSEQVVGSAPVLIFAGNQVLFKNGVDFWLPAEKVPVLQKLISFFGFMSTIEIVSICIEFEKNDLDF